MSFGTNGVGDQDAILSSAVEVSRLACLDLTNVLNDVQDNSKIDTEGSTDPKNGLTVAKAYGYSNGQAIDISTASGAMVVDDLMQKISTKVQSAAQMLSAANNINKTASRLLSQG